MDCETELSRTWHILDTVDIQAECLHTEMTLNRIQSSLMI